MNSSPSQRDGLRFGEQVLRGDRAGLASECRFDVDLRHRAATADTTLREAAARAETSAHAAGYAAGWSEGRR
ncbi:MAG: hypothetical protein HKP61_13750, partial [Dactylosporangium sp.]|nr:hypothetical protein [Dactylosporangium sp.]NNJ61978.1 hypothetical protein [Dactylosporangium sp.]